jgi:hypothetical protein
MRRSLPATIASGERVDDRQLLAGLGVPTSGRPDGRADRGAPPSNCEGYPSPFFPSFCYIYVLGRPMQQVRKSFGGHAKLVVRWQP